MTSPLPLFPRSFARSIATSSPSPLLSSALPLDRQTTGGVPGRGCVRLYVMSLVVSLWV